MGQYFEKLLHKILYFLCHPNPTFTIIPKCPGPGLAKTDWGGGVQDPQNVDLLDPKMDFFFNFAPQPSLTKNRPFLAHFVACLASDLGVRCTLHPLAKYKGLLQVIKRSLFCVKSC